VPGGANDEPTQQKGIMGNKFLLQMSKRPLGVPKSSSSSRVRSILNAPFTPHSCQENVFLKGHIINPCLNIDDQNWKGGLFSLLWSPTTAFPF
jgi:hypothetical protein